MSEAAKTMLEQAVITLATDKFFTNRLWVARDPDGSLFLFSGGRPSKQENLKTGTEQWFPYDNDGDCIALDDRLFSELTPNDPPLPVDVPLRPQDTFTAEELKIILQMAKALGDVTKGSDAKSAVAIEAKCFERLYGG